jgi:L-glyceraldehyde 3-phosphate reductase
MYSPNPDRYKLMKYRRLGNSGLVLPVLSFGMWYNFGANNDYDTAKAMILKAFDHGITHFDLANNYGPPPGHAESVMGRI